MIWLIVVTLFLFLVRLLFVLLTRVLFVLGRYIFFLFRVYTAAFLFLVNLFIDSNRDHFAISHAEFKYCLEGHRSAAMRNFNQI
jgi:hypothetical protein